MTAASDKTAPAQAMPANRPKQYDARITAKVPEELLLAITADVRARNQKYERDGRERRVTMSEVIRQILVTHYLKKGADVL